MFDFEEIVAMNPPTPGQRSSALDQLLRGGSAWPALLCESAEALAHEENPTVYCFAQLPFRIGVKAGSPFRVRGATHDVTLSVSFVPVRIALNRGMHAEVTPGADGDGTLISQVVCKVPVLGGRARQLQSYRDCLGPDGLRDEYISSAVVKRPKKAIHFQSELVRELLPDVLAGVNEFLSSYSACAIEDAYAQSWLYSYFAMMAPGRIAFASAPLPVAMAVVNRGRKVSPLELPSDMVESAIRFSAAARRVRELSRFERRLIAMERLRTSGEPELALTGALFLAEWFVNSLLAPSLRSKTFKDGSTRPYQWSLSDCFVNKANLRAALSFVDDRLAKRLVKAAEERNAVAHGPPPTERGAENEISSEMMRAAREVIELTAEFLRTTNRARALVEQKRQMEDES